MNSNSENSGALHVIGVVLTVIIGLGGMAAWIIFGQAGSGILGFVYFLVAAAVAVVNYFVWAAVAEALDRLAQIAYNTRNIGKNVVAAPAPAAADTREKYDDSIPRL
ncbi:MAG: hypothetical protein LBM98_11890 [Oscillospiraceae bacterium]|jgi:HAMP domain-containing protein|nr:hypothetical protein [Oscillospiraceae bacterium]